MGNEIAPPHTHTQKFVRGRFSFQNLQRSCLIITKSLEIVKSYSFQTTPWGLLEPLGREGGLGSYTGGAMTRQPHFRRHQLLGLFYIHIRSHLKKKKIHQFFKNQEAFGWLFSHTWGPQLQILMPGPSHSLMCMVLLPQRFCKCKLELQNQAE